MVGRTCASFGWICEGKRYKIRCRQGNLVPRGRFERCILLLRHFTPLTRIQPFPVSRRILPQPS